MWLNTHGIFTSAQNDLELQSRSGRKVCYGSGSHYTAQAWHLLSAKYRDQGAFWEASRKACVTVTYPFQKRSLPLSIGPGRDGQHPNVNSLCPSQASAQQPIVHDDSCLLSESKSAVLSVLHFDCELGRAYLLSVCQGFVILVKACLQQCQQTVLSYSCKQLSSRNAVAQGVPCVRPQQVGRLTYMRCRTIAVKDVVGRI